MTNSVQSLVRLSAGAVLAATLCLAPRSAMANGATVDMTNAADSYCFTDSGSGTTYCYENSFTLHVVQTPSGRLNVFGTGSSLYSETGASGTALYSDLLTYQTRIHETIDGALTEMGQNYKETLLVNGQTCSISYAFHFANDQIQFERLTPCQFS
jgi:hypothetical protein